MIVYGCEINSRIDGGAPGYFIIGPFANKEDADEVTKAYNKLIEDGRSEEANIVVDNLNTFGYHEDDHGYAHTVEIPVYENLASILNGNTSIAQTFNIIVKKYEEMMAKLEAERKAAREHIDVKAKILYDDNIKEDFNNIIATDVRFPDYSSFDIRVRADYSDSSRSHFDCIFYGTLGVNNDNRQALPSVDYKCISKKYNQISEGVIKNTINEIGDCLLAFLKMASGQNRWMLDCDKYEDLVQLYYAICETSARCAYYKYGKKTGIDINKLSINIVKLDENVPENLAKKVGALITPEDCE